MKSFLVLMRGRSPESATMVAATAKPELVGEFARRLLRIPDDPLTHPGATEDEVEQAVADGRREALELIWAEVEGGSCD